MRARVWLACLGLGLGLVLAEGAARLTGDWLCADVPGVVVAADPVLGWRQRPNLRGWAASCRGKSLPPTLIATDERGFLDAGRPIDKPPGTARILLLGGNVPQAFGVPRSLSIAGMLESRADARRGRPLEVVNGAMGSFGLDQDLLLLRAEGARVAPDLVLVVADPVVEANALTPELIALASVRAPAKTYFDADGGTLVPRELPAPEAAPPPPPTARGPLAWSALHRLLRGLPRDVGTPLAWLPVQPIPMDVAAERARGDRVLEAVLAALRDEATRLGARLAIVVLPPPRETHRGEQSPTHRMLTLAGNVGVPATSLVLQFQSLPATMGSTGYIPGTTRFNADGHFLATHEIWAFLERERLLPDGVVSIRAPGGGRVAPLAPFPDAVIAAVRGQAGALGFVPATLLGVVIVWLAAPLSARGRDVVTLGASLLVVWLVAGTAGTLGAAGFAVAFYLVPELPYAWLRRTALGAVTVALVVAPTLWLMRLPTERSVALRAYVGLAVGIGGLRGLAYAVERRRRGERVAPLDFLNATLFFATFATGPIQSVRAFVRTRGRGLVPESAGALGAHLVAAGRGALRVAWGSARVLLALACLNLVTPDVLVSGGESVARGRVWLWLGEMTLYFWLLFGGWSDLGIGLAAMAGVRAPENFRRPWAATTLGTFWRHVFATVTTAFGRLVTIPVARRFGLAAGLLAGFLAGAAWYAWTVVALYGFLAVRPGACVALAGWASVHALATLALGRARRVTGRPWGWIATHGLVALTWVLLLAFPYTSLGRTLGIYGRLVGLR